MSVLAPGLPGLIADQFANREIEWEKGWGDHETHTCLHGALLRPCAEPGDEIMWSVLLASRGLTIAWNDEQVGVEPVVAALRQQAEPDDAEMVRVFGGQWKAARWVCRTYAQATDEQKRAVRAVGAARAARAARDAWAAARAAWAAWAAWDAWDAWAAWDARHARAARAARDALVAVVALDVISADDYKLLVKPFEDVFGTIQLEVVA